MKTLIATFCFAFCISHFAFSQQYGWKKITANLPAFPGDTIINGNDTSIAMMRAMFFLNDQEGWTTPSNGSENCCILHTVDGGETWKVLSTLTPQVNDIHMLDQDTGFAGGQGGIIRKTTDGGHTWNFHGTTGNTLTDIEFPPLSHDTGYACGFDGGIFRITPTGISKMVSGVFSHLSKVSFPVSASEGWVCGESIIRHFKDGQWNADQVHITGNHNAIDFLDNQNGWACGDDRIIHTTDGYTWEKQLGEEQITGTLFSISFYNKDVGCAVGMPGHVFFTENGGASWKKLDFGTDQRFQAVQMTSPTCGYIIGDNKAVYKYTEINGTDETPGTEVVIRPNPTSGKFAVGSRQSAVRRIEVLDFVGRVVFVQDEKTGAASVEFDISHLPAGAYFCRISFADSFMVKKIVKL